jgi:MoxR-like ATPase
MGRPKKNPILVPKAQTSNSPLMEIDEIEERLAIGKTGLSGLTLKRYDPDGTKYDLDDPNYRSDPQYVPSVEPTDLLDPKIVKQMLTRDFSGKPVQLVGGSGCGKTNVLWRQYAARLGREWHVWACNPQTTPRMLLGGKTLTVDETTGKQISPFALGPIPIGIQRPGAVCTIDEIDTLEGGVLFCIQSLLDKRGLRRLVLTEIDEVVIPAEGVFIGATSNTMRGQDDSGLHVRNLQDFSHMDRFHKIPVSDFDPEKIIKAKFGNVLHGDYIDGIVKFVKEYRNCPELNTPLTTRKVVDICEQAAMLASPLEAIEECVIQSLPLQEREAAHEFAIRFFPNVD